ncbi:putative phosphoribosyl transferase [Ensifer sp. M14]|uniref:phosphoribosyltransferase n=1 Tax=Ensifer sp. M14 TaxID=2203782 RepID=UPI000E1C7153|nr:phosphoribosyltransferase [Ensifer sp. M14]RDL47428.1 putative phosphoribosyl transferase [Ensifer sp. M14]
MRFSNRSEAGKQLAIALKHYRELNVVVLALARGGVPVGAEVANALDAPLEVLLVRKIGVPWQPEVAMGAVVDGARPIVVRDEAVAGLAGISEAAFETLCQRELVEIERRRRRYFSGCVPLPIAGRIAIVVDDGIATGSSMRAAVHGIRQRQPLKIVVAVPVASPQAISNLQAEVDEVVCLYMPPAMGAVGYYYDEFAQVSDDDVVRLLAAFQK